MPTDEQFAVIYDLAAERYHELARDTWDTNDPNRWTNYDERIFKLRVEAGKAAFKAAMALI